MRILEAVAYKNTGVVLIVSGILFEYPWGDGV